jgi:hypothetical protein
VPHTHRPPAQRSESGPHAAQVAPAVPHSAVVPPWHTPFQQQPLGQFPAEQPEQVVPLHGPFMQVWHAMALTPHASSARPLAQPASGRQHPSAQLAGLQVAGPASVPPSEGQRSHSSLGRQCLPGSVPDSAQHRVSCRVQSPSLEQYGY